jgi:transposase InsO family protein
MNEAAAYYYDPRHPASFGGAKRLLAAVGKKKEQEVKKWLQSQRVYTLHKPARKRYNTRPYKVRAPYWLWQADLVEMIPYKNINEGYRYLLTVIDVFSRKAWARPLKSKTGVSVRTAFDNILQKEGRAPVKLQTDQGKEFGNIHFQQYLKHRHISFFTIKSQFKAALCERWNRTLKEKMWRYFTYTGKYRWIDVLQDLVSAYNNALHRSLNGGRMTPNEAAEPKNTRMLWLQQEGLAPQRVTLRNPTLPPLNIDDYVKLSKAKRIFDKGYLPSWTEEVFQVSRIIDQYQPVEYKVKDWNGEEVEGSFYRAELQKVNKPVTHMIEHIIRQRKNRQTGHQEYFIKWFGYGPQFNTWEQLDKQTVRALIKRK